MNELIHQIRLRDALPADGDRRQWLPVLPAGTIKALRTPRGPRQYEVTESYLRLAVSEHRRYNADMERLNLKYSRPILVEHERAGRRRGDLLDAEVKLYDAGSGEKRPTLFLLVDWRESAWEAIQANELEHVSVRIDPEYIDPQTGHQYAPFIVELSETATPVIKDFKVQDTLDPTSLEGLGLRLSENADMEKEAIEALIAEKLNEQATAFDQKLETQFKAFGDSLVEQLKPAPAEPPPEAKLSDDDKSPNMDELADKIVAKLADKFDEKLEKQAEDFKTQLVERDAVDEKVARALAAAQGVKLAEPGNGGAPTEPKPTSTMDHDQALALAEKYYGGHAEVEKKMETGALEPAHLIDTAEKIRNGDIKVA